nr:unnamed protein product [Digitaria exilis]
MGYPRAPLLLLLVHLCLVLPGAAGLSFSYDFSIPDPGGINRKILRTVPDYGNSENRCNGVICLNASTEKNSSARVYYKQPVRLWDGLTGRRASFRTSFSFALHGGGGRNTTQGPGTAFFIGPFPSSLPPNSGGGLLGLGSNPTSPRLISQFATPTLAVEFDTQWDPDWDPSDVAGDHVGIDLDMIVSDSYSRDLARGDLSAGTVTADIAYDAGSNVLEVTVRLANGSTTSVRALVNLRKQRLPQDAAIGFSTGTGAADTNYDPVLISWSFSSTASGGFDEDRVASSATSGVRQVDPEQGSLRGTAMIGSYHYMDPQCTNGSAATASDVYSFGVVLLEIATGRRSQASLDPEKGFPNSLVSTVRESYHKGSIVEVADPRLNGDFDESQMTRVLTVGLLCVQLDRKLRPDIREAINMLSNPSHPVPQLGT